MLSVPKSTPALRFQRWYFGNNSGLMQITISARALRVDLHIAAKYDDLRLVPGPRGLMRQDPKRARQARGYCTRVKVGNKAATSQSPMAIGELEIP
jgi:hypothetical protein